MISDNIDKALKSIYKIGGIYFGIYEKVYLTYKFKNRRTLTEKCKAKFYCYIDQDHLWLYDEDSNAYLIRAQLLVDLFPELTVIPVNGYTSNTEYEFRFKEIQ